MFERLKIKKLISRLQEVADIEESKKIISQISQFGKIAFPLAADSLKERKIDFIKAKSILEKTFGEEHIDKLISLMGDSSDEVRAIAKEIIKKKLTEKIIVDLIESLQNPNMYVRSNASEILSSTKNQACIMKLVSIYNGAPVDLKKSIIGILSEIEGNASARLLIMALRDKDWSIRIKAVKGLGKIKHPKSVEPLIGLLDEKDPQIKKDALDALIAIGDGTACKQVTPLLMDSDFFMRQKAVDYLSKVGTAEIIPEIIKLMRHSDVNVRRSAVEILNNLKDTKTGEALVSAMKDMDWWVREIATDALAEIKGKNVISIIKAMLKDKDENIRRCAVHFFNKVNDPTAVDPLIEILEDEDWWVREKAISALGNLKDKKAIKPIVALLNDEEIKGSIPEALAKIGGEEVYAPLLILLKDKQKQVRIETLKAFGQLKNEEMIPHIKPLMNDSEEEVRNLAGQILKDISGRVFHKSKLQQPEKEEMSPIVHSGKFEEGAILSEAILVVDLCNSTAMADKYGDHFALNLTNILTETVRPIAQRENFNYMKSTGDGFLITFSKIEQAVRFSFDLLEIISARKGKVDPSEEIDLRFAINFGETRLDSKGDRLGLATNMAFRVEGVKAENLIEMEGGMKKEEMKKENRILVTEKVIDEANLMNGITSKLIGLFELKGIAGLHRVFELNRANTKTTNNN